MKKILTGALVGGLIYFFWSGFYYVASGMPLRGIKGFKSEDAVIKVLTENAPEPGYYVLPTPHVPEGVTGDAARKVEDERMQKVATGYWFAGAVRPGGLGGLGGQLGASVVLNILTAGLITWLLLQMTGSSYGKRLLVAMVIPLITSTMTLVPTAVWWGTSCAFTGVEILDVLVGWSLAGAVLAKIGTPD